MPYTYDITSKETGRTYRADFEKEPSPYDLDATAKQFDDMHDAPSELGSAVRSAVRSAAPAFGGGRLGGAAGAALGGAIEGSLAGSEVPVIGNIIGGLVGAGVGMWGAEKAQTAAADYINPSVENPLSTKSQQKDIETNPISSEAGGFLLFKPNPIKLGRAIEGALNPEMLVKGYNIQKELAIAGEKLEKELADIKDPELSKLQQIKAKAQLTEIQNQDPKAYNAFLSAMGVGGNVGIGAAQGLIQGDDAAGLLKGAALGSLFNDEWLGHGEEPLTVSPNQDQSKAPTGVNTLQTDLTAPPLTQTVNTTQPAVEPKQEIQTNEIQRQGRILDGGNDPNQPPSNNGGGLLQQQGQESEQPNGSEKGQKEADVKSPHVDNLTQAVSAVEQAKSDPSVSATTAVVEQALKGEIGKLPQSTENQETPTVPQSERIVASAYKDPNGEIHIGEDHKEALRNGGYDTLPYTSKKSRETPDFGFLVKDSNGAIRFVDRNEAESIGAKADQIDPRTTRLKDKGLHSSRINGLKGLPDLEYHEKPTTPQEAKFKNGIEARKAWEQEGQKDVKESFQEYLNRKFCA